jgi:hypothetical protein
VSFAVDTATVFCADASEELASAHLLEKRGRWILAQTGSPAVVDGPRTGTFARRLNGTTQFWYANVVASGAANAWRDIIQSSWTLETCVKSRSHATAPTTRRTLFMAGYNGVALAWLTFRPTGGFELLHNLTTDSVLTAQALAGPALAEDAWTYVALRKTVTSGSTPSNRLSTLELWARPVAEPFGSSAADAALENASQSGLQALFSWNIGANAGGPSANSPMWYGVHDQGPIRLSSGVRSVTELEDSFGRLSSVSQFVAADVSDYGVSGIVGDGGYR